MQLFIEYEFAIWERTKPWRESAPIMLSENRAPYLKEQLGAELWSSTYAGSGTFGDVSIDRPCPRRRWVKSGVLPYAIHHN